MSESTHLEYNFFGLPSRLVNYGIVFAPCDKETRTLLSDKSLKRYMPMEDFHKNVLWRFDSVGGSEPAQALLIKNDVQKQQSKIVDIYQPVDLANVKLQRMHDTARLHAVHAMLRSASARHTPYFYDNAASYACQSILIYDKASKKGHDQFMLIASETLGEIYKACPVVQPYGARQAIYMHECLSSFDQDETWIDDLHLSAIRVPAFNS